MHSSRMLWGGCTWSRGGGVPGQGGVPGPGGCVPGWGGYLVPGVVYLVRGGTWSQVLPPVDRHTPVNILPCPKLRLRAVKIKQYFSYVLIGCLISDRNQYFIILPCITQNKSVVIAFCYILKYMRGIRQKFIHF